MFSDHDLFGKLLPDKTLCLTFDDGPGRTSGNGPGPKTAELASYLASENISATFFMVGKHIVQYAEILPEVAKLGHIIGNHAFCHHKYLTDIFNEGWDFISEIEWTDQLIKKYNPNGDIYFRAPWGRFSAEIATKLNESLAGNLNHIGPFLWDIGGGDWSFWQNKRSSRECTDYLLNEVRIKNHGIMLMHDSTADLLTAKNNNLTLETMELLIPQLKAEGYSFVNIDAVPITI